MKQALSILSALVALSLFGETAKSAYSNFPSESAVPREAEGIRILHSDDFTTDTLHRIWGCSNEATVIEDGVLKSSSNGGPSGKLKVAVEPFQDVVLSFRFRLLTSKGFGFDDLTAKALSHGGHLIGLSFSGGRILVKDTLTGIYNMAHYEQLKAKQSTPELDALVARSQTEIPFSFNPEQWHEVQVSIHGDLLRLSVDKKEVLQFRSPGIAHPRKDMYRFNVGKGQMEFDDFSLVTKTP